MVKVGWACAVACAVSTVVGLGCAPDRGEGLPGLVPQFHGEDKLGWARASLQADEVRAGLEVRWSSGVLDPAQVDGAEVEARVYASPLLADGIVFVASSSGWVYALDTGAEGATRWRTQLGTPIPVDRLDGGVPLGVLSTPVLRGDTLYVVSLDARAGWLAYALDVADGEVQPGWPVVLDAQSVERANRGGAATFLRPEQMSQRGALALSPDGERLYVPFGTFWGEGAGWMVELDTTSASIAASFASAPETQGRGSGGIWGAGGPLVLPSGEVLAATGNAPAQTESMPGVWGSSLLALEPGLSGGRHYTPFNYCVLDEFNMDLGASQALVLPDTSLVAMGGKQGTVYLIDLETLAPMGNARPPCRTQADTDDSLLPPGVQPQYGTRGPLSVFGPYSDVFGEIDHAKMRSRLAYYADEDGAVLFASGSTKASPSSTTSVPPSVIRLRVVEEDAAPYLAVDAANLEVAMLNPGSPVVSSGPNGAPVVWVLDRNAPRVAPLLDPATPEPILYAFDGRTLELLWQSPEGLLGPGGKYVTPLVAGDTVVVATDRVQALSIRMPG
ncbi:MAG: PQQ-binding-like beta-propeller repeat protein [Myxococcota bacterium]